MSKIICVSCSIEKPETEFKKGSRILKSCFDCRQKYMKKKETEPTPEIGIDNYVFSFGKHKGKNINDLLKEDKVKAINYLNWCMKNLKDLKDKPLFELVIKNNS